MATSQAVESFWKQLAESGLISERQVRTLARDLTREGISTDAAAARKLVELGLLTRYQASRLLEGRSRGFFFDQYKLLDLLGVGGMGWVYRASHTETGEIVALKVLLDQFKHDRGMLARFEQEGRASQIFHHENIVRTFSYGSAGGLPYMIMEFVEGPSLLELLRMRERSRLPWEQACDIARQAALGLHHVHLEHFVHRDVKPQNLLIDRAGHVKLLDFGLSMLRDGERGDEFSMAMIFGHECVGTAAYTAPEQAIDSLKSDARSDIYGLGCTLFASLTGDTPFPLSDPSEVLKAHRDQHPRNVCDVVPSIPRAIGEIVAKMLAKKPEDRFDTAADVAETLAVWAKCLPVEFDFAKILAERTKNANQKMVELQKRQRNPSGAASSTALAATMSSVASRPAGQLPASELGDRSLSSASSIARRDPFGFEHQPSILVRKTIDSAPQRESPSTNSRNSGMFLLPLSSGTAIPLNKERFVIGRSADCDLQVQDAAISGRHCEVRFDGRQWSIADLNSRNGIRVNGDVVRKQWLHPGDTIIVGNALRLRFGDARIGTQTKPAGRIRSLLVCMIAIALVAAGLFAAYWFWHSGR